MEDSPTAEPHGGSFRFSLLALLLLTAMVAVSCSLLFASQGWVRVFSIIIFVFAFPTVWVATLIYGRGYLRTFAIGALCSGGTVAVFSGLLLIYVSFAMISSYSASWSELAEQFAEVTFGPAVSVACFFGINVITGRIAVATRWMIESSRRL